MKRAKAVFMKKGRFLFICIVLFCVKCLSGIQVLTFQVLLLPNVAHLNERNAGMMLKDIKVFIKEVLLPYE